MIVKTDRYSVIESGGIMPDEKKFGNPQVANSFE